MCLYWLLVPLWDSIRIWTSSWGEGMWSAHYPDLWCWNPVFSSSTNPHHEQSSHSFQLPQSSLWPEHGKQFSWVSFQEGQLWLSWVPHGPLGPSELKYVFYINRLLFIPQFPSCSFPCSDRQRLNLPTNSILSWRKAFLGWSLITFLLPKFSWERNAPAWERAIPSIHSQHLHLTLFLCNSHANLACNQNHLGNLFSSHSGWHCRPIQ